MDNQIERWPVIVSTAILVIVGIFLIGCEAEAMPVCSYDGINQECVPAR